MSGSYSVGGEDAAVAAPDPDENLLPQPCQEGADHRASRAREGVLDDERALRTVLRPSEADHLADHLAALKASKASLMSSSPMRRVIIPSRSSRPAFQRSSMRWKSERTSAEP